jgi:hypothetical protein
MLRLSVLSILFAAFAGAASAQTAPAQTAPANAATSSARPVAGDQVRINLNLTTFVAAPTDNSEQSLKAQADGRRKVYELAASECGVLRQTLASDCRLESINVNVQRVAANRNFNMSQDEGFNITGNVSFRIVTK